MKFLGDIVFVFRFSLSNIYIWNVIAIVFFCIKFLPEFLDVTLLYRILIALAILVIYFISTQIKFFRHIVCIAISFLWSFLIAQTADYYFQIGLNTKILIYITITIIFYIWHLLFMENPFNIVSAVAVEAPTEFSPDIEYMPKYIPYTDTEKSGSYLTQYFNYKNISINNLCEEFINKISVSTSSNYSEIMSEYQSLMKIFNEKTNKIITDCNSEYLTTDSAKIQIDEVCDQTLLEIKSLINKL